MAGLGSRFREAGYLLPKPLINVVDRPMIQVVTENLDMKAHFIFIVQKSHVKDYSIDILLKKIKPNCTVIEIDELTEGAACTALLAEKYINNNESLLIANSDQFIEWNKVSFLNRCNSSDIDGLILTFKSTDPNCSYVKTGEGGYITQCREKERISTVGTVGIYFWSRGKDFVRCAHKMIEKNLRVNREFYICPSYNEAIAEGARIKGFPVEDVWQIGTPVDLQCFVTNCLGYPDGDPDMWANIPPNEII